MCLPHIVALAPNPWHGIWMNRQQLLSRLASRGWPVIYSTGPLNVWERGSKDWRDAPFVDTFAQTNGLTLDVPGRLFSRWPRFAAWDNLVLRHHARRLAGRTRGASCILYAFNPSYATYLGLIPSRYVVYHPYDAFALMPGWTPALAANEELLASRADMIIATSPGVINSLPGQVKERARLLPNGADVSAAQNVVAEPCPEDLARIPEPRIGYTGSINPKLDFRLLLQIARHSAEWNIILIGEDRMEQLLTKGNSDPLVKKYAECKEQRNVHFLGRKPQIHTPLYSFHMSVNIIPYLTDKSSWASAGSPLKMFEYLATGKPVICSELNIAHQLTDVLELARTDEEWISAIEHAIECGGVGTPESRRSVAQMNSWDSRVDQLDAWLRDMVHA